MNKALQNTQTPDEQHQSRDLDPNVLQRRASAPDSSVWVSASAGTGKTKVLTDRVLRLLLPRKNGQPGTPAHKIMCLTFTKAAASEMAIRISETLASWAVLPMDPPENKSLNKSLNKELKKLLGRAAESHEKKAARQLFADVVDVPGGLKIMTIHAFCQSILARFPLEAGIKPHFTVLDETQTQALLSQSRDNILSQAKQDKTNPLSEALNNIATIINEEQFTSLIAGIVKERGQLERLFTQFFDYNGLYTNICAQLGLKAGETQDSILGEACKNTSFEKNALFQTAQTMLNHGSSKDQSSGQTILNWINLNTHERRTEFETYQSAFLKKTDRQIKSTLAYKKSCEVSPDIPDILTREAIRLTKINEKIKATNIARLTRDLFCIGKAILDNYAALKTNQTALDFDDLILRTLNLLNGKTMGQNIKEASSWVHYKLDQGLDHILIDEAQDTNPEQWEIIGALCHEFFENTEDNNTNRTVFTVGDEKQSIYSFQRASPEEFARMQNNFKEKVRQAKQNWDSVPMNISFRSTQSVLKAVDTVFSKEENRKGLGELPVKHTAFRRGQAGLVELWPVFESDETPELDLWAPLTAAEETSSGQKKLAVYIAKKIQHWLSSGAILESKNRPIRAGDIMILVRTRSALVNQIARELKNYNINVSGLDRMVLSEELSVQDLISAAEFSLQPLDNLALACMLKSPLIGMSEETLLKLSAYRERQSLWESLQQSSMKNIIDYCKNLRLKSRTTSPFEFFSHILQTPCPNDEISARRAIIKRLGLDAMDPVDELLNLSRDFEQNELASLQHFIRQLRLQNHEIKREQDGKIDEVRIMTIHGSKGLQSPIVLLPDTTASSTNTPARAGERLLWPSQTAMNIPLWSPRKNMDCAAYMDAVNTVKERQNEEYRRLLYVAMTRAEDRLYVGGALGKKQKSTPPNGCWYDLIQNALEEHEKTERLDQNILRLSNPQTHDHEEDKNQRIDQNEENINAPDWIRTPAPATDKKTATIRPSNLHDTSTSPLNNAGTHKFIRGNLTHKLLQLLPQIPSDKWENASKEFLNHYGKVLDQTIHTEITTEILNILNNPDFAPLFDPSSMAEVPVTGYIEGKGIISGQIDRLLVTPETIWVIDYKTNRPPPKDIKNVPEMYQIQMEAYAQILTEIYPDRAVKAALLWTDGPFLMPLDIKTM